MQMKFGSTPSLQEMLTYAEKANLDYVVVEKETLKPNELNKTREGTHYNAESIEDCYVISLIAH